MAGNPVFTSHKRKFSYSTTASENSTGIKQPFKRKKSKENIAEGDDFDEWDDDLLLTQQELTDLDVAASQAYIQKSKASTSHPGNIQAPTDLQPPSRPAPHPSRGPLQNEPNVFIPKLGRHASSSTSSSSTYPLSSSTSFESFSSSHSTSSNCPKTTARDVKSGSAIAVSGAPGISSTTASISGNLMGELQHLREEMKKYETLKEEMYMKEGQIKFLRDELQRRELEVSRLHQEKMNEDTRERSEKENHLKAEVERLSVELQFKNQEMYRLKEKCIEQRPNTSSSDTSTLMAGSSSPKVRRILVERPPPHSNILQKIIDDKNGSSASPVKTTTESLVSQKSKRNCSIHVHMPNGVLHGSRLMSQLLQNTSNPTESVPLSNPGTNIVPLLHLHTTLDFQGVKFCRDANNFLLSPVAKSGADIQRIVDTSNKKKPFVSNVNLNLAMYGISKLLTMEGLLNGRQLINTSAESASQHPCPSLLLLPLLGEYFTQYAEQLSTQLLTSQSLPSDGNTSASLSSAGSSWRTGSAESSLESLGSSLNLLQQVRSDMANNLEQLTLLALRVIFSLASFSPGLRWTILTLDSSSDTEKLVCSLICTLTMTTPDKKNANPSNAGSSFSDCISQLNIERLELLNKFFKLANPLPEMSCNPQILEVTLALLVLLAKSATNEQLERFAPVVTRGILCHSLGYNSKIAVQLRGLQLMQVLAKSPQIVASLCADVELCPLGAMYTMVGKLVKDSSPQTEIYPIVIDILNAISNDRASGMSSLLNTRCPCNMDCVKCCVNLLYDLLEKHQSKCVNTKEMSLFANSNDASNNLAQCRCLNVLSKGILLLHSISQQDQHFEFRYQDVIHNYTILVSRLHSIMEREERLWKTEISALKELSEFVFDPDSSMDEDESQTDTPMETT